MFIARPQDARPPFDSLQAEMPPICEIVQTVAIKVFKEMAVAVTLGAVITCFVATPSGLMFMISSSIVQFAVSAFFHSLGAFAAYKVLERNSNQRMYAKTASLCEWITGCNFGLFSGFNSQIVIHESGHALASLLIYRRPRPLIEVFPFVGGSTQFYKTGLTPLGKKLGAAASTCFVIASGPAMTLFVSSALLTIGIAFLDTYPQFGKYLISWSLVDFLNHAVYAYSAMGAEQWNLSHDFVHLSIFGLHPVAASVGILAIPIVISLGMYWMHTKEPPAQELAAIV